MKIRTLAAFALAALPWLAQPASAKDDLVIGVAQFPSSLHPAVDAEVIKSYVLGFTTRPITAYDKDWKNSCLLCSELPTLANGLAKLEDIGGKKGMAVTIKLRTDLKWSDGKALTTDDLVFTWNVGKDPASGFTNGHPWSDITSIEVINSSTAVLHLSAVTYQYNTWDSLLPAHIEGPVYEKAGNKAADYLKQTVFNRAPTTPGLGNGPYMISDYKSGVQVVLTPNPFWPGAKPGFKRIVIKLIENTAALQANLLSGDIDMVAGEGVGLTIDQVIKLRDAYPDKFTYVFKPSLTYEHIDLKVENPILADVRVRRAMLYALDRKTLVDKLFGGMQPVAQSWVNPLDPNYTKNVTNFDFDRAKAKALLTEAGWTPGKDGICTNKDNARLSVEFGTTAGNRLRELVQQVLQDQLKAACIDVTLKNEPPRTFFGETIKKRLFNGLAMYAWSSGVGSSPRRTLHSAQIPTEANNYTGSNAIAFNDPRMDTLIDQAESELDPAKQLAVWAEMQKIYVDKLHVLPLFYRADPHVVPKWLLGYTPTGHGDMSILWAENWKSQ